MSELFRAVSERLKALFTAHAALELESELIARHVERKGALLRQAARLEGEGLTDLAAELRTHAGAMDLNRPAPAIVPMLEGPRVIAEGKDRGDGEPTPARRKR